jgi:hypothetical protein
MEIIMENKIEGKLPEFEVTVLGEMELRMVTGGSTAGTHNSCNADGTNDAEAQ